MKEYVNMQHIDTSLSGENSSKLPPTLTYGTLIPAVYF